VICGSGRLVAPLPHITVARTGYVAVIPRHAESGNLVSGFVDWLAAEAQGPSGDSTLALAPV
jgi:LysR family glycine cleavage system transcriptional activator